MLLDHVMLETGCFDKPCRIQVLNHICQIAVQPHDDTAEVVEGSTSTMQDAFERCEQAETLLLHDFKESQTEGPCSKPGDALRQLCLSSCSFDTLPSFLKLEVLILWKCSFRSISKMPKLKALVIVDSFVHPAVLSRLLQEAPSLQRIALIRAGDILNTRKDRGYYLSPCTKPLLVHSRQIREIVLQNTLLPCPDIVHAIQSNPCFTKLAICETWLPDPLAFWMAHAIATPSSALEVLKIKDVQWSPRGSLQLINGLRQNRHIKHLDFSSTLWYPCTHMAFHQFLQTNDNIVEIKLNSLVDPSLISGALEACLSNATIKKISLARNHLDVSAMSSLTKLLKSNSSLEQIDLSCCVANDPSCWEDALVGLSSNASLKLISLERCQLGDVGAAAIGKVLSLNQVLESIDLCHNCIGMDGTSALVEGLKNNRILRRLFLHGNKNENQAGVLLRDMLRDAKNSTLRVVFLPESSLQEELQYYGALNYAGRKHVGDPNTPHSLWPKILERALDVRLDVAFFLLRQKPDLVLRTFTGRKRCYREVAETSDHESPSCSRIRTSAP